MRKENKWITHVKKFAAENGINYAAALKDPRTKASYREEPEILNEKVKSRRAKERVMKPEEPEILNETVKARRANERVMKPVITGKKTVSSSFNANLTKLFNIIQQTIKNLVAGVSNSENNNKGLYFYVDKKELFNDLTEAEIDSAVKFFVNKTSPNLSNKENVYKTFLDAFNNYKRLSIAMTDKSQIRKNKSMVRAIESDRVSKELQQMSMGQTYKPTSIMPPSKPEMTAKQLARKIKNIELTAKVRTNKQLQAIKS